MSLWGVLFFGTLAMLFAALAWPLEKLSEFSIWTMRMFEGEYEDGTEDQEDEGE